MQFTEQKKSIRIRFFSSFCDTHKCKQVYESMYTIPPHIEITTSDDYTHVILLNTAMPVLPPHFPTGNVLGLAHEPTPFLNLTAEFIAYAKKHIGKYLIGHAGDLGAPFVEHYGYLWHNPAPTFAIYDKPKCMSLIVSQKNYAPGHKYRHKLLQRILQTSLPIDIYGRCSVYYDKLQDPRIKGTFEQNSDEPYRDYQYHICIENFSTPAYYSEKLTNCFLYETTPIYWGADRVCTDALIRLTGNVDQDMQLLQRIVMDPAAYMKPVDLGIKDRLNLFLYEDFVT